MDRQRRNIEIKARLRQLDRVRDVARNIATEIVGVQRQTDTYLRCRQGRLKLREIEGQPVQLIWYDRPNVDQPKASNYCIIEIDPAEQIKDGLAMLLGVRQVVAKTREVFLYQNVRIHLDEVRQLGTFLELEAVLQTGESDQQGRTQVHWLLKTLGIDESDLLPCSYVDLFEASAGGKQ